VAGSDPVDGVIVVRHLGSASLELIAKSYRPGPGRQRRLGQLREALAELPRAADPGPPEALVGGRVVGGEGLPAARVEDRQPRALRARPLGEAAPERVERVDPGQRQAGAGRERLGAGDADPQAGERARAEPDRYPLDRVPAACRRGRPLDLLEQPRRVPGAAVGGETEQRLVEDLAAARSADGGVLGRRVEADQRQLSRATRGL
jgi:hypothetical protein